jgi:streptomycin 6-kinase
MFVEVFPFDRRLPHLSRVLNGASRDVGALLMKRLGRGRWQTVAPMIEPTRYRTELGAELRYTLLAREEETGRYEVQRCSLKLFPEPLGGETFRRLQSWTRDARTYALVQPIAYLADLHTLVLEEAQGTPLRQVLLEGDDPLAGARATARALAAFHQDDLDITRTRSASDQREALASASALTQWACPEARARIAGVTAVVARNLPEAPPAPLHGDLGTDRVFLSGDRVVLPGADHARLGDPVGDPALLFAHMEGRVGLLALPQERAHEIAAAFCEEYFRHVPTAWRRRFRWHCAAAFIEAAADVFRSQEPGWRNRVVEMASSAQRALAGGFG